MLVFLLAVLLVQYWSFQYCTRKILKTSFKRSSINHLWSTSVNPAWKELWIWCRVLLPVSMSFLPPNDMIAPFNWLLKRLLMHDPSAPKWRSFVKGVSFQERAWIILLFRSLVVESPRNREVKYFISICCSTVLHKRTWMSNCSTFCLVVITSTIRVYQAFFISTINLPWKYGPSSCKMQYKDFVLTV